MATITKTSKGYKVQVFVNGERPSKTFPTEREAKNWAAATETELRAKKKTTFAEQHTLLETIQKFSDEESIKRKGGRWERIRLSAIPRQPHFPANKKLSELEPADFNDWKKARLIEVEEGSFLRDCSLLGGVFTWAKDDLLWIEESPLHGLKKPAKPKHRDVTISWSQQKIMLRTLGYSPTGRIRSISQCIAVSFLFALRTGMRAGEITGLQWDRVKKDYCIVSDGKTDASIRNVPFEKKTIRLIEKMRGFDDEFVFCVKSGTLDTLFRQARKKAGLSGFRFHDSRHTAATWMAKRLDVLTLCKVFGWTNPKMAMVYYNPTASDIAKMLNQQRKLSDQSR